MPAGAIAAYVLSRRSSRRSNACRSRGGYVGASTAPCCPAELPADLSAGSICRFRRAPNRALDAVEFLGGDHALRVPLLLQARRAGSFERWSATKLSLPPGAGGRVGCST